MVGRAGARNTEDVGGPSLGVDVGVLGRVVHTAGALPAVHPVSYALCGQEIIFRTGQSSLLRAAMLRQVLAVEVDDVDPNTRTGWTVRAIGKAHRVTDTDRLTDLATRLPPPGAPDEPRPPSPFPPGCSPGVDSAPSIPPIRGRPRRLPAEGPHRRRHRIGPGRRHTIDPSGAAGTRPSPARQPLHPGDDEPELQRNTGDKPGRNGEHSTDQLPDIRPLRSSGRRRP